MLHRNGEENRELAYLRKLLAKAGLPNVTPDWSLNEMKTELARRLRLSHREDKQSSFEALDIALSLLIEFDPQIEVDK